MIAVYIFAGFGLLAVLVTAAFAICATRVTRQMRREAARRSQQRAQEWQRFQRGELPGAAREGATDVEQIEAINLFVQGKLDPLGWQKMPEKGKHRD